MTPRTRPLAVDVMLTIDPREAIARAEQLAATGVDGVFTFENMHDVFFPLVLAAGRTDLDLMTNVAIALPRSPLHLAHAAYDLQLMSEGRFRLGLGTQIKPHVEKRYGATWVRPVAQMREIVLATKAIMTSWHERTPLRFEGEFTRHTLMTPNFDPGPHPFGLPPVLVGALGPRMAQMAAEVADGILVMPFNTRRHLDERTLPALEAGLATAGRERGSIEVITEIIIAMGDTDEQIDQARTAVKALMAFYGSTPAYRAVLDVHGWGELQGELNGLSKQGRWVDMAGLITDEMAETIGIVGTPAECGRRAAERFGDIAERVCAYFPGYPVTDDQIAAFTDAVHAAS
jgi:probable F420-dependent oxidoreductase